MASRPANPAQERRGLGAIALEGLVIAPVLVVVVVAAVVSPRLFDHPDLLGWAAAVAIMDLVPIPSAGQLQLSLSFPILLTVAMLYAPPVTAAVALAGSFDPRELRRSIPLLKALFIRAEVALSVLTAGILFHAIGAIDSAVVRQAPAVAAAIAGDLVVNTAVVGGYLTLTQRLSFRESVSRLHVGSPVVFFANYVVLGALALVMAKVYGDLGPWAALLFFGPLLLARQLFFRTRELERAGEELVGEREELRQALAELERLEAERGLLLNRTVQAAEEERRRLAAELHDGPIQHMAAAVFRLDDVRERLRASRGRGTELAVAVGRTQEDIRDQLLELREIVSRLRPPVLDQLGLADALRQHVEAVRRDARFDCQIDVRLDGRLDPDLETVLYRVSQEALTNVTKHAGAGHVWITLEDRDGGVRLRIRDDGVGFGPERLAQIAGMDHVGLIAMRERVERVGGTWEISSEPGLGTEVRAVFASPPV